MRERIVAVFMISLLLMSFSVNVFSVETEISSNIEENTDSNSFLNNLNENKTLEEQKQEIDEKLESSNTKLEYVQGEMSVTLQKVMELQDEQQTYQKKYEQLQGQIISLSDQIKNTDQRLKDIQEKYQKKEEILKKKVVALYESGDTNYIDLLLSSRNIIEFLSNYFLVSELIEYDNNLLDEMEDTQKQIEKTKQEQEQQEEVLRQAREEIDKTQILLENTKTIQQNYAMKLSDKERELQQQIEKYKAEQEEIEKQIAAAINWAGTFSLQFTNGVMIWPVAMKGTYITSGYGIRRHPIQGVYKNHAGLDISGAGIYGAPVVAASEGMVIFAGVMGGYGNCVMISHGDGLATLYGHGSEIIAQIGQTVKQGDIIMKVGSTGVSTGPHVHFEIRKNGVAVDPIPYLNGTITNHDETENTIQNILENITNTEVANNDVVE